MYAIIETGGKQYKVAEGDTINVEKLSQETGDKVTIDKVLAVVKDESPVFGKPYVESASVSAEVVGSGKDKKVIVFKQKPRKGFRRLRGHRQSYTTLKITKIGG